MTEEEDKRISAEYGVTPGAWHDENAGMVYSVSHGPVAAIGDYDHDDANARLMAASKEMVALLERALIKIRLTPLGVYDRTGEEIAALLERLKGGSHE